MQLSILLLSCLSGAFAFDCLTCNNKKGDDDSKTCIEKLETCPEGVESCSMVTYFSHFTKKVHVKKFCTTEGTPLYKYLLFFPGSSLCQNIKTDNLMNAPRAPPTIRARRQVAMPPAPPIRQASNLLCVCTTPLCNKGTYKHVLESTMLDNVIGENKKAATTQSPESEEELFA